jgi:hypothetical protein
LREIFAPFPSWTPPKTGAKSNSATFALMRNNTPRFVSGTHIRFETHWKSVWREKLGRQISQYHAKAGTICSGGWSHAGSVSQLRPCSRVQIRRYSKRGPSPRRPVAMGLWSLRQRSGPEVIDGTSRSLTEARPFSQTWQVLASLREIMGHIKGG